MKRVLEKAALRLRIVGLKANIARRQRSALTTIAFGESVRDLGRSLGDAKMLADGFALMDLGHQQLNEIETGLPAEPRPAAWWHSRAEQSADGR